MAPKSFTQRIAPYAKSGTTRMHAQQAAGPARAGRTGKIQNVAPGAKRAAGGPRTSGRSSSIPSVALLR
jgi:hypothetical protein